MMSLGQRLRLLAVAYANSLYLSPAVSNLLTIKQKGMNFIKVRGLLENYEVIRE